MSKRKSENNYDFKDTSNVGETGGNTLNGNNALGGGNQDHPSSAEKNPYKRQKENEYSYPESSFAQAIDDP